MLCLENIWRTNKHARSVEKIVSWKEMKITCLVNQSIMTKMILNLEDDGSFLTKSIEMEHCMKDP